MNIFIPENLKKIKVISQLCKMIEDYSNYYEEEPADSFNDYDFYMSYDPVKKFITLCLPEEEFYDKWSSDQDYDTIINYLSRLFYSVKGTRMVLEYMRTYLDLTFIGDIIYSPGYISFKLDTLNISDEAVFRDLLEGFLSALLFYENLDINIAKLNLTIEDQITSYIQGGVITYRINYPTPITEIDKL